MSGAQVISLGCRLNIAESEGIAALVAGEDDVVVINSCAVTTEAVRQTRQAIRRARKDRPDARLLVTGCAADIERDQLAAMPEVDGLVPNTQKLDARRYNLSPSEGWDLVQTGGRSQPALGLATAHTRAFVAVQNGCDHACTFCVIPQGRGTSRSLSIAQVLREVERHLGQGAPEVVLTGVDVTSWGHDLPGSPPLGELVRAVLDAFPQLQRLRMSSLDGVEIDPLLFELFASEERVMPHLHLSMQHGSDLILKRMKRRHLRADAIDLVQRLKARRTDIAIGADLIAGFPTETCAHHADNLSIIDELQIVHGHIFPYSPRPNTPAARMPQLDKPLIKARAAELRAAVARVRSEWLDTLVGTPQRVLTEKDGTGYSPAFARVDVPEGTPAGTIVTVTPSRVEEGLLK
ncbi:tRNA (N(6)-L-threonylcarbamoyladenosine(37)-C(2))-methylthiotransferase MtaB [Aurantiacibacter gangjinensis]|uniref:2-methylthioadenine synthase n=1 Tax=Aurantiacibacter gangjinensis TaxID=502682 RepID=A0A0G9MUX9_9SPHN|nr:tRNA (N(6)-L-threonylcarbamoyladenosine(37)-C(2))-methylthiotransferase MtaB [Aurantiacibacter gangjinensis]APE28992.1 tRNA-t(6)A37 methylthiotransferase [Aurantiacibacter gangjinensis]KLE33103.1 2-methylthioadenine synthase [Aurantiacibacter gangjinensis]